MKLRSMILTAALVAVSFGASAQSEETLKHAATMEAIGKMADAMKAMAEANGRMAERANYAPQPIMMAPRDVECTGFMNCTVAGLKGIMGAVRDVAQIGNGYVGPIMAYRTAIKQYDYQAVAARESTIQEQSRQGTLQSAFGTNRDIATSGFTAMTDAAASRPPGQIYNVSGNGNNFGSGALNYGSYNPVNVNPDPRIVTCTPVLSPTGAQIGTSCAVPK